ncbi:hypothetical protein O3Q51_09425 [Cryomorphaceae bacterium 1068]|nr:hypothetical protein [Cryomorphaceae bacterium 1068]
MEQVHKESTFITVLAWILIVLSALSTVMSIFQLFFFSFILEVLDSLFDSSVSLWDSIQILWVFAYPLIIIYAFISAIGLLRRRNWARVSYVILFGIGIAYNVGTLIYTMNPAGEYFSDFDGTDQELDGFVFTVGLFSILVALGFSVLYGWLIKKLTSEKIKIEFNV